MKPRLFVARRLFDEVLQTLHGTFELDVHDSDQALSPPALCERLQHCEALLAAATEAVDPALLDACPRLRAVALMTVGHDNVDLGACTARGVFVSNAPDVLTQTTADFGLALLLAAARRVAEADRFVRCGAWTHWGLTLLAGQEVHGTTLGLVGMGRIGQAIARRAALGFGMRVRYHNRAALPQAVTAPLGAEWRTLDALLTESDHLMLCLPYTPVAHHLIGAPQLARMKPTATLVNLARGGVVDEVALAAALREGRLAAAALDVFEGEPAVAPELLGLPTLVLTPHIASSTIPTRRAMAQRAADNLLAFFAGREPPTPLNAVRL